jgi:hypothetical protein
MQGLTDGISSRYLRTNRTTLIPGMGKQAQAELRIEALHGRLEELLVFEIVKEGCVLEYNLHDLDGNPTFAHIIS